MPQLINLLGCATAGVVKYAVVVVRAADGSFDRDFRITAEDYAALAMAGAGAPSGVTAEEWVSGQAQVLGMDMDIGDFMEFADGSVRVILAEKSAVSGTLLVSADIQPEDIVTKSLADTPPSLWILDSVVLPTGDEPQSRSASP